MDENSMLISSDLISDLTTSINHLQKLIAEKNNRSDEDFLGFRETKAFLGLSESHLRKLVFEKKVPVTRVGTKLLFSKSELREWIKES